MLFGLYRGFIQSVLSLGGSLLSIVGSFLLYPRLADVVASNTDITRMISTYTDSQSLLGDLDLSSQAVSGLAGDAITQVVQKANLPEPIGTLLQHKGFFSAKHIYEEAGLSGGFLPFDFATFAANPAKVTIESFDRDTGKSVYWTKDDMQTIEDLMVRVRASSTLPLVMPSPKIGASHYYDGGLGEGAGFLLPRAQRDGFTRFLIVRTRPREYRKTPPLGLGDKITNAMLWGRPHVVNALESRWWKYNNMCDEIERLEATGDAYVFYARDMAVSSGETDIAKLQASYDTGYAQAMHELPAIREFLGI